MFAGHFPHLSVRLCFPPRCPMARHYLPVHRLVCLDDWLVCSGISVFSNLVSYSHINIQPAPVAVPLQTKAILWSFLVGWLPHICLEITPASFKDSLSWIHRAVVKTRLARLVQVLKVHTAAHSCTLVRAHTRTHKHTHMNCVLFFLPVT